MFRTLNNFGYKRTIPQAIGFYLLFLIISFLLVATSNLTLSMVTGLPMNTPEGAAIIEITRPYIIAIVALYCALLSFIVAKAKGLHTSIKGIFVILFTIIISFLDGSILGLIPPMVLTMADSKNSQPNA